MRLFLALVVAFLACAQEPVSVAQERLKVVPFHADKAFTPEERAEFGWSRLDWTVFSGGRVRAAFTFDVAFGSFPDLTLLDRLPTVVRAESWMRLVTDEDAMFSKRYGHTVQVYAWTEHDPTRVYLVIDRIEPGALRYILDHEIGHVLNLRWPKCDDPIDCDHVPGAHSIMSVSYDGAKAFTSEDLVMCRASGLCP